MRIDLLADHPEFLPDLARAILDHWKFAIPDETLETRITKLIAHAGRAALPISWVAHDAGAVLGMAALREHDLEGYEHLSPWLGGVLVMPGRRRHGVGAALCAEVEQHARRAGHGALYLFTLDRQAWYAHQGWTTLGGGAWRGHAGSVMEKRLD